MKDLSKISTADLGVFYKMAKERYANLREAMNDNFDYLTYPEFKKFADYRKQEKEKFSTECEYYNGVMMELQDELYRRLKEVFE